MSIKMRIAESSVVNKDKLCFYYVLYVVPSDHQSRPVIERHMRAFYFLYFYTSNENKGRKIVLWKTI